MHHNSDDVMPSLLIDEALARVLASQAFRGSARKRRFLQFIVQQTQAGHADRIKGYTIAIDVFDRDPSFDPALDPVVRIQAGRVRQCLERYYLTEGAADPVQITIPKGGYVPRFVVKPDRNEANVVEVTLEEPVEAPVQLPRPPSPSRGAATWPWRAIVVLGMVGIGALSLVGVWSAGPAPRLPAEEPHAAVGHGGGPSLMVLPFADGTGNPAQAAMADSLADNLAGALIRSGNLVVFGAGSSVQDRSTPSPPDAEPRPDIDYVLKGSVEQAGAQVQITVALIDAKSRQYLWSEKFRHDTAPAAMIDLRHDIAAQVTRVAMQSRGPIHTASKPATAVQYRTAPLF